MPGQRSYGPGGKWIHDRAHHMLEDTQEQYGDEKGKQIAYALATQQAHKVGKSPKGFRTPEGVREAKRKHDKPRKEYQVKAAWLSGFFSELTKIGAAMTPAIVGPTTQSASKVISGASRVAKLPIQKGIPGTKPGLAGLPKGPSGVTGTVAKPPEAPMSAAKGTPAPQVR